MRFAQWDGKTAGDWASLLEGARAVINLTGKSVNCRYTPAARAEILNSRVDSVRVARRRDRGLHATAAGLYPGRFARDLRQFRRPRFAPKIRRLASGFSAEFAANGRPPSTPCHSPRRAKSLLRIGFALKRGEGALRMLENLARFFLGGTIGSGQQYISWIHIADLDRMFMSALERDDLSGPFNATGPAPDQCSVHAELRRALHRPWSPPVPAWLARLGARAMGTEPDLALHGFRCLPQRFLEHGFRFDFTDLRTALADVYGTAQTSLLELGLRAAAIAQFGIALLNFSLVRIMRWKPDLDRLPLLIREVFQVHLIFISV